MALRTKAWDPGASGFAEESGGLSGVRPGWREVRGGTPGAQTRIVGKAAVLALFTVQWLQVEELKLVLESGRWWWWCSEPGRTTFESSKLQSTWTLESPSFFRSSVQGPLCFLFEQHKEKEKEEESSEDDDEYYAEYFSGGEEDDDDEEDEEEEKEETERDGVRGLEDDEDRGGGE